MLWYLLIRLGLNTTLVYKNTFNSRHEAEEFQGKHPEYQMFSVVDKHERDLYPDAICIPVT